MDDTLKVLRGIDEELKSRGYTTYLGQYNELRNGLYAEDFIYVGINELIVPLYVYIEEDEIKIMQGGAANIIVASIPLSDPRSLDRIYEIIDHMDKMGQGCPCDERPFRFA